MKTPRGWLRGSAVRKRYDAIVAQSERTILLAAILLASSVSALTVFVMTQYFAIDALSSLVFVPDDCYLDWGGAVGRHCFSDYGTQAVVAMQANPWEELRVQLPDHTSRSLVPSNYPAAGALPHAFFALLGQWLGSARLGFLGYLLALTAAVFTPAVWAARGARGLERVVVFVACGVAAIPGWMAIDRGNSVGFVVPIVLVYLMALSRQRWGLVVIMVILAAIVKPQFAVLGAVLFAARQWRYGGIAVVGVLFSNIAAYALWPKDFPTTIIQSIHNVVGYGSFETLAGLNVSFAKGLLMLPDGLAAGAAGGKLPDGYLAGPRTLIGYVILLLVVIAVLVLGRRIPPLMAGIVLLPTGFLFPPTTLPYYLVFVLPIAAVLVRDPDGPPGTGIFDRPSLVGGRRRAVGIWVTVATAVSIAHIPLPGPTVQQHLPPVVQVGDIPIAGGRAMLTTTAVDAALLWLIAIGVIVFSYARRPVSSPTGDRGELPPDEQEEQAEAAVGSSSHAELKSIPHNKDW